MSEFVTRKIKGSEVKIKNFNRLLTEFNRIFGTNMVLPEKREKILEIIIECLDTFRVMEQKYREFCELEKSTNDIIVRQIEKGVVKVSEIEYEDPTFLLRKQFEDFMIRGQFVIRYRNKICMIIFEDNKLDEGEHRRKKLKDLLKSKKEILGSAIYNMYEEIMKDDEKWLTLFTQTRDKIEHVEKYEFMISEFRLALTGNTVDILLPTYKEEGQLCHQFMNNMFSRLYLHIEDFISMLLNLSSDGLWIVKPYFEDVIEDTSKQWYSVNLGSRFYRIDLHDTII
jgi:hypothetical protein